MKRMIFCEGKTDAILISYFLQQLGWSYIKKKVINFQVDRENEVLNWYAHPEKPEGEVGIWGCGGIDEIPVKLKAAIERTRRERKPENRVEKIVVFCDRDTRNESESVEIIAQWARDSQLDIRDNLQLGEWVNARTDLRKTPPESHRLTVRAIAVPPHSEGALETFLLNSLKTRSDSDSELLENAQNFIDQIPDEPYLERRRFRPKACLGAVLSVMSPDWVFSSLNDRLTRVPWEQLPSLLAVYQKLEEL